MFYVKDTPKGAEHIKPIKSTQHIAAGKPEWSNYWSKTSLTDFLKQGMKEE